MLKELSFESVGQLVKSICQCRCFSPFLIVTGSTSQETFTCLKSTIKTLKKVQNMSKANNKDTRTTSDFIFRQS